MKIYSLKTFNVKSLRKGLVIFKDIITNLCQHKHFIYKILQYTCFNWSYLYISESHNYHTRSSTCGDIKLATPSNNQLMRTFKYNSAKLWNALVIFVRGKPSLNSFKGAYLKDVFTHRYFLMVL